MTSAKTKTKKPQEPKELTFLDLDDEIVDLWERRATLEWEISEARSEEAADQAKRDLEGVVEQLKESTAQLSGKWDRCARFLKAMKAREEACRAEAQFLAGRAATYEKARKRLGSYLCWLIQDQRGEKKVHGEIYSLTVAKTAAHAKPINGDETDVPADYTERRVSFVTRKSDITKDLKAGKAVPNWELKSGRTIRIY